MPACRPSEGAHHGLQAVTARLNALESDNAAVEEAGAASDDEFDVDGESEDERSSASDQEHIGCDT